MPQHHTHTIIIGGGLSGLTMACALGIKNIPTVLIETGSLKENASAKNDGRASALAYGSQQFFQEIGLWQYMQDHAGEIRDIRVTDGDSRLFLHYDHTLIGEGPVGYMVENHIIRKALLQRLRELPSVIVRDNSTYSSIKYEGTGVKVEVGKNTFHAQLLIAADGKFSKIRQQAHIKTRGWEYQQHGIVCTVCHEKPHQATAQERFLPPGPFAVLPLQDPHCSSLVWTEPKDATPYYMQMEEALFCQQIKERMQGYLGEVEVITPRFSYPLSLVHADNYTAKRLALIGDAAHAIHPLAGQGFNLGIRDVMVLQQQLDKAYRLGLDIGTASVLQPYEDIRKFDALTLIAITDGMNRLFQQDAAPVKLARRVGMATVNRLPGLKRLLMRHAMGTLNN